MKELRPHTEEEELQSKPEPAPESKPEPKPEPAAEPKPEPKPEPKSEPAPEPEPKPEPKPEPQVKTITKPEAKPEPEPEEEPEMHELAERDGDLRPEELAEPDETDVAPAYTPGKKKGRWKWVLLLLILIGAVVFFVVRKINAGNALPMVTVEEVKTGSIEETVTISGSVASAEKKTYYATLSAPLATFPYNVGDRVSAGDVLYTYDAGELEKMKHQAELNIEQATGNYQGSLEKNAKATNVLRGNSIGDINNRLTEITAETNAINDKITEKLDRMNGTLSDLQKTLMDVDQNNVSDSTQDNRNWAERTDEEGRQMYLQVQNSIQDYQYAIQHDPEIEMWKRQLTALSDEKATLTEQKSAESARLTGAEKKAMEAQLELTEISNNTTISDIDEVAGGIHADITGVITEVNTKEGATVTKGSPMLSIESTEQVEVAIQITKNDMSKVKIGQAVEVTVNGNVYDGEVIYISGVATKNSGGVAVVDAKIRINNPDEGLILGVEASNKIHTNHADNVVVIPYEYVGADADGDYVFVVENGLAKRRAVTVGLTTSTEAEITEGLKAGDFVITGDTDSLTDGTPVGIDTGEGT